MAFWQPWFSRPTTANTEAKLQLEMADMIRWRPIADARWWQLFNLPTGSKRPVSQAGRSAEIRDLRPFSQGDDRRHIHWRVSAKAQQLIVKHFDAEHDEPCALMVDLCPELLFGSVCYSKSARLLEMASLLLWSARYLSRNVDVYVNNGETHQLRVSCQQRGIEKACRWLLDLQPKPPLQQVVHNPWQEFYQFASNFAQRHTLAILTDLRWYNGLASMHWLSELSRHHYVMLYVVRDALESSPPLNNELEYLSLRGQHHIAVSEAFCREQQEISAEITGYCEAHTIGLRWLSTGNQQLPEALHG